MYRLIITIIILVSFSGCRLAPVKYQDEKLKPFLKAIAQVKRLRDSLGFSPVSETAKITIEGSSASYDAMLHVYQNISSRTIAFKKYGGKYVWIGEQEIFTGPRKYKTVDGTFNETITFNYETQNISGYPINQLGVIYAGPDTAYTSPNSLSGLVAQALIKKWKLSE